MRKAFPTLALSLLLATLPALAQTAKAAPKPPPSPSQVLLLTWNEIGRKLIAMAEDFPEDKYDFKPVPAQRSFAEQLLHAANANYYFLNSATGQKPPAEPKRSEYKTKAQVVAFVKKAFTDGAALITKKGDAGLNDILLDPFDPTQQARFSEQAYGFIEHSGEHYGQLVVYYRTAGQVPPESRPKK